MPILASSLRCLIAALSLLLQRAPLCQGFELTDRSAPAGRFVVPLHRQRVPVLGVSGEVTHKSVYFGTVSVGAPQRQEFSVVFDTGSGHVILPSSECQSASCRIHRSYRREVSQHAEDIDWDGTEVEPGSPRDQITIAFGTGEVTGQFVSDMICLGLTQETHPDGAAALARVQAPTASIPALPSGAPPVSDPPKGSNASDGAAASINCVDLRIVAATEMTDEPFLDFSFDGVLGLGLASLALAPEFSFFEMLNARKRLDHPSFGVFLADHDSETSEISFGGHSPERLRSELAWAPVAMPEQGHWLVSITRLQLDSRTLDFCNDGQCRAVIDSGTSLLAVPTGFAGEFSQELEAALQDPSPFSEEEGCKRAQGATIRFELDGVSVMLTPADYARLSEVGDRPRVPGAHNTTGPAPAVTSAAKAKRCWAAMMPLDLPEPLGPKIFILGEPVLRKYYTEFNWKEKRIGFGLAAHATEPALPAGTGGDTASFSRPLLV